MPTPVRTAMVPESSHNSEMCEKGTMTVVGTPSWLWDKRAIPQNGISIDSCIADQIMGAWAGGVRTLSSCCGHGKVSPSVVIDHGVSQAILAREVLDGWRIYQWGDGFLMEVTNPGPPVIAKDPIL